MYAFEELWTLGVVLFVKLVNAKNILSAQPLIVPPSEYWWVQRMRCFVDDRLICGQAW